MSNLYLAEKENVIKRSVNHNLMWRLTGPIIGIFIAILLVGYQVLSYRNLKRIGDSEFEIILVIGILVGGAVSGLIIQKFIARRAQTTGRIVGCIAGATLISPLSLFWAVISGSLGGGIGEQLFSRIGKGDKGIYFGILCSTIIVIVIWEFIGAVVGAKIGSLIRRDKGVFH